MAKAVQVEEWGLEKTLSTGTELMESVYQEEKRLGILFWRARSSELTIDHIDRIAETIDRHVYDWATCDTLCGVLRLAIANDPSFVPRLIEWSDAENLWRRRAACVSFLSFARKGEHLDAIETICDRAVRMNERFVQLGVGWLLREVGVAEQDRAVSFLRSHFEWISREGLRYALEKMPKKTRVEVMDEHKAHADLSSLLPSQP